MPAKGPTAIAVVFDGSPPVDDIADLQLGMCLLSAVTGARHAPDQLTLLLTPEMARATASSPTDRARVEPSPPPPERRCTRGGSGGSSGGTSSGGGLSGISGRGGSGGPGTPPFGS